MGIKDRAEAAAKNIEGKVQEAAGEVTGNESDKAKGEVKQGKARIEHAKEDIKDQVKKAVD